MLYRFANCFSTKITLFFHYFSLLYRLRHATFLTRDFSLDPLFIIFDGAFRPPQKNGESGGTFCPHSGYGAKILFRFIIHTTEIYRFISSTIFVGFAGILP